MPYSKYYEKQTALKLTNCRTPYNQYYQYFYFFNFYMDLVMILIIKYTMEHAYELIYNSKFIIQSCFELLT